MVAKQKSAYASAGVDIDTMDKALAGAKKDIKSTMTPQVVSDVGSFGGLHESPGRGSLLVTSIDGVGTKLKVATMAGRHDTVGQDLVNHCVNDILVQGARPLMFLDYVGTSKLDPAMFVDIVKGLSKACRENGCALISGETAEMPGIYPHGEYDLVGAIIGTVPRKDVVTGEDVRVGDAIIGLPSTGLQTNGYSLARKIIFDQAKLKIDDLVPGTRQTVARTLLAVHCSYLRPVSALMDAVKVSGMAHITGGGIVDNIPRVLPDGCSARIVRGSWKVPTVFSFMQTVGKVDADEMFRVFNMGIGYAVIVRGQDLDRALAVLKQSKARPKLIGEIVEGDRRVVLD